MTEAGDLRTTQGPNAADARRCGVAAFVSTGFLLAPGTMVAVKDMAGSPLGERLAFAYGSALALPALFLGGVLASSAALWVVGSACRLLIAAARRIASRV